MLARLKRWAQRLRVELAALHLAASDPRVPRAARWLIMATVAYALSPIDLIPDFIPVLGLLDDLLIVPAALWLAMRMVPAEVWAECRQQARGQEAQGNRRAGVLIVVALWLIIVSLLAVSYLLANG